MYSWMYGKTVMEYRVAGLRHIFEYEYLNEVLGSIPMHPYFFFFGHCSSTSVFVRVIQINRCVKGGLDEETVL